MGELRELIERVEKLEGPDNGVDVDVADGILHNLGAAGYRILAPGELDVETVERCIKELNKLPWFEDVVSLVDVEDALRALEAQEDGG